MRSDPGTQNSIQLYGLRTHDPEQDRGRSGDVNRLLRRALYLFLLILIVSGNTLTFRVAGRVAVKVGDIAALLLGLFFLKRFFCEKICFTTGIMLLWGILSFLLVVVNTCIYRFSFGDLLTALLYLFRFLYMLCLAKIVAGWVRRQGAAVSFLRYVNGLYLALCGIGFLQLIFFPVAYDFYALFWAIGTYFPDADPHVGRLISTYFDPNYFASCLLIGICVNYYLMGKRGEGKRLWPYLLVCAVYFLTILLTKSRSGLLGFVILTAVCAFAYLRRKRIALWKWAAMAIALFTAVALFLFSNISTFVRIREVLTDASAQARFQAWEKGFEMIRGTNLIGIGYNLTGAYQRAVYGAVSETTGYGNDSSLLLTLITTGIFGFALFSAHLWSLVSHKKAPACAVGLLLAALVICNFNNLLYYQLWVFPFYFTVFLMQREDSRETLDS